jgi:dynein heavy chain 2
LRDSKYASRFSDQLEQFDKKLGPMDELLRKLNLI